MVVAGRGSVKRGSSALPEDRAQDEECHHGHDLAAKHDPVDVNRRLPAHLAIANNIRTCGFRRETKPGPAVLGIVSAASAAPRREREVLRFVIDGASNDEIGARLTISARTWSRTCVVSSNATTWHREPSSHLAPSAKAGSRSSADPCVPSSARLHRMHRSTKLALDSIQTLRPTHIAVEIGVIPRPSDLNFVDTCTQCTSLARERPDGGNRCRLCELRSLCRAGWPSNRGTVTLGHNANLVGAAAATITSCSSPSPFCWPSLSFPTRGDTRWSASPCSPRRRRPSSGFGSCDDGR